MEGRYVHGITYVPAELGHGVGKAEHAGADHGGDIVEGGVPPLGVPPRVDGKPVVDVLLLRGPPAFLRVRARYGCQREAGELQKVCFFSHHQARDKQVDLDFYLPCFIYKSLWQGSYLCRYISWQIESCWTHLVRRIVAELWLHLHGRTARLRPQLDDDGRLPGSLELAMERVRERSEQEEVAES